MRRLRPKHVPILLAWAAVLGILGWLGTHPGVLAPYASNLVSVHLLRMEAGGLRVGDVRVRPFEGLDLFGVSLTLVGRDGGLTLVSADTVLVDFSLEEALGRVPHLRRVVVANPRVYSRSGSAADGDSTRNRKGHPGPELPALIIDHLEVADAFLEFSGDDGRLRERISDLDWRGAVRTDGSIELVLRGCGLDWETHDTVLRNLRGLVTLDAESIRTGRLLGSLNGDPVTVSGSKGWDDSLDLKVTAADVSIREIEDLIDMGIGFSAEGSVDGTVYTSGDTLVYAGLFEGTLEGYAMTGLRARALILPQEVLLTEAAGTVNGAGLVGSGRFDLSDPEAVTFVLDCRAENIDLAAGLVPGVDDLPRTDGRGRLRIEHSDRPEWTRVTGMMEDGRIDVIPFDDCTLDVEATPRGVRFNSIVLKHRDLVADLTGSTDSLEVFTGRVDFVSGDLASLPDHWGWPRLAGQAGGSGTLSGPVEDLAFRGRIAGRDLGLGRITADSLDAKVQIGDVLEAPSVAAAWSGEGLRLGEVPLGGFKGAGSAGPGFARMDSFRSVLGDTVVALAFTADLADSLSRFEVPRFRVDLEGTSWRIPQAVGFDLGDGYFALPDVELVSPRGALALQFEYRSDEAVTGTLDLETFDLTLLNPFVPAEHPLSGRATARVRVAGHPDAPVVTLSGDLTDAPFALATVDSLHVEGGLSQGVVTVREFDLHSDYGRLRALGSVSHPGAGVQDFWAGAALDLDLEIRDGDWAFLEQFALPALDRLAGRFDGDLHVGGTTAAPECSGALTSAPFHIHWLHLDELQGSIWVDQETLVLGDLKGRKDGFAMTGRLEIPVRLDFLSEPVSPPDGPLFMQLVIPEGTDLEPLSRATNAFVSSSGRGSGTIIVAGPLEHPLYQGELQIRNAGFVLRDLEEVYAEASCDGRFLGDELLVTDIRGREGLRGRFSGGGRIVFKGLELETFDVRLDLDRFLVASIPDLAAVVSGRGARLTGVKVGPDSLLVPKFSGDLTVDKAQYSGDFSEKPGAADPREGTVAPDWLADLRLHAEPRVAHIVNREMELDLGGDLNLIRDEAGLNLRGSLDINKGRLIVFNNDFEVVSGRLDFSRDVGFDPRVDIQAQTKYRLRSQYSSNSVIEHIGVQITGSLLQPVVEFSSERGYSREAIQRMLLGLEPEATPEGDAGRLTNSSITAGFNLLEREIARELDLFDTFEIRQIQRQREAGNTGLDPLIGVGKYLGSDLYLKYAQGIRQDDRDFLVEYQINAHLLLQSEIRRRIDENQGEPTYNLDLKYRFEY
ncbi:MAG: translocation/assembly module TamB domain-containing protein [Candidatus Krumholzibacteriia bacterium]